jgi:hypothetical protein
MASKGKSSDSSSATPDPTSYSSKSIISSLVHEIKTGFLKNSQGLSLNGDIDGLLSQVDVVCTLNGLDDNAQRLIILQCIEANSLKALLSHLKETKVPLSVQDFNLQSFVDGVRSFFALSSPIHVLLHDLLACPIDSSTPESLAVSLESFIRKFSVVKKELEKPSAPFFLYSSRLPDWLRTSSFQYLLQNPKAKKSEFSSYISSYSATRSSNSSTSKASLPSSSSSSSSRSDSTSSETSSEFCRYCRTYGHLIDSCDKRIQSESRKSSSTSPSHVKGLLRSVHPSDDVTFQPFRGHPCVPCKIQVTVGANPVSSHIVLDPGSPVISLIHPDFARKLVSSKLSRSEPLSLGLTIGDLSSRVNFQLARDIQPPLVLSLNDMMRLGLSPDFVKRILPTPSGNIPIVDFNLVNPGIYDDSSGPPRRIESISTFEPSEKFSVRKYGQSFWDHFSSSDSESDSEDLNYSSVELRDEVLSSRRGV